jgi:hypothetical protein
MMRRPSYATNERPRAAALFARDGDAAAFGATVHALLAQVEWKDDAIVGLWRNAGGDAGAVSEAEACLRAPALQDIWSLRGRMEAWRERAFEIVLDDAWVTGVFDRVVVERAASGRAEWVTVFDFKTDRVEDPAVLDEAVRRHSPQLNMYRQVAAVLAGVPVDAVTCELVFTRIRRRVRVAAE